MLFRSRHAKSCSATVQGKKIMVILVLDKLDFSFTHRVPTRVYRFREVTHPRGALWRTAAKSRAVTARGCDGATYVRPYFEQPRVPSLAVTRYW